MKTGWGFTGCLSAFKLELKLLSVCRNRAGEKGLSCTHGCQNSWVSSNVYFSFQKLLLIKGLGGQKGKRSRGKEERSAATVTVQPMICIVWVIRWQTTFILRIDIVFCSSASESDINQLFNSGKPLCCCSHFQKACFCAFGLVDLLNTNSPALGSKGCFYTQLIASKILSIFKNCQS